MTHSALTELRKRQVKENKEFLSDKLFLEFGVFEGCSILEYYDAYVENELEPFFFGFDSFEGLPEETVDQHSPWTKGNFSTNGFVNLKLLNKEGLNIIPGWFHETLNEETFKKFKGKKAGLIHIDCDIYTSTLQVLEFLIQHNLITNGTLIVYDDWGAWRMSGLQESQQFDVSEAKAHKEICEKYDLNFELMSISTIDPLSHYVATFKYIDKR